MLPHVQQVYSMLDCQEELQETINLESKTIVVHLILLLSNIIF